MSHSCTLLHFHWILPLLWCGFHPSAVAIVHGQGSPTRLGMVNIHGPATVRFRTGTSTTKLTRRGVLDSTWMHLPPTPPPDPQTLLTLEQLQGCIEKLQDWIIHKQSILTITGAGLSTESGIPDYRGNQGSYHQGHKPMIHDQFMASPENRKRYWGRGLVGWKSFDLRQPNAGHVALAKLERKHLIGVEFEDSPMYHSKNSKIIDFFSSKQQRLSIVTQNVDALHHRAGSKHVTELHGRTSRLKCMQCGAYQDRTAFTNELELKNQQWLKQALETYDNNEDMRPDGDAQLREIQNYNDLIIPSCKTCGTGFLKPDVVFFGDTVPSHRVARCQAAVEASDGLLCIGTSLAVHSAFRFVRMAALQGIDICILNVGQTRAEAEGLPGITKIEAPIGKTLEGLVDLLD